MPLGSPSSCHDFQKRLDLFLDGEVDGRTMRVLALHVARCASCESELGDAELVQERVALAVRAEVDQIDAAPLWRSIEARLESPPTSWLLRLRERWELRSEFEAPALALAATALVAIVLAGTLWSVPSAPTVPVLASNQADIDRLSSSAESVAVWTEPRQHTTAIWVSYEP